jgi:hypothetical protein
MACACTGVGASDEWLPGNYLAAMIETCRTKAMLLLAGLLLFTGCITIEEHYTFRKNGSGSMTYVVDMSELGGMMEAFSESGDAGSGMGDMGSMDMSKEVEALKGIPGVSKVKLDGKKKWVQRISFDFKDVDALNAALNQFMHDSSGVRHEFFRWEGNTLVRTNNRHAHELGAGLAKGQAAGEEEDADGEDEALDMSMMLESMKYKYSFKFASDIVQADLAEGMNKKQKGRELVLDTDFAVIGADPQALDLRIVLK